MRERQSADCYPQPAFLFWGHRIVFSAVSAMSLETQVAAAIVNFQTPDLIGAAARSFHETYPDVHLLLVDNGSGDESPDVIAQLSNEFGDTGSAVYLPENHHHGPAMDLAIKRLETPFVFLLDSDTETKKPGFLEEMISLCRPADVYGAGKVVHVNRRGFAVDDGIPVLVSAFMLIKRGIYLSLPPFVHHGLPALKNFEAASREGYRLLEYPVESYVEHLGRGTAERFGYGLGLRGRLDYLLNRLGL